MAGRVKELLRSTYFVKKKVDLDRNCVTMFESICREVIIDGTGLNYIYYKRLFDYYCRKCREEGDVWTPIVHMNHNDRGNEYFCFMTRIERVMEFLDKSRRTASL